jgi:methylation protein EvaC
MSFGSMPIANGFLMPEQFADEYFFELAPAFCESCEMFQIVSQPAPEQMFHENYAFFSGTSRHMAEHFKRFAESARSRHLGDDDPFVVEIGSNDGILIGNLAAAGIRHLGVEPSANVAEAARAKGVDTEVAFFGEDLAGRIVEEHGQANAVLAANVICHIGDIGGIARGIKRILKPGGVFVFEEPYLGAMIEKGSYDQIYDEHVFIFSVRSVAQAFGRSGLEIIDAEAQPTHGGSMRYTLAHSGARTPSEAVARHLAHEGTLGLSRPETYAAFRARCERSRDEFVGLLDRLRGEGKRVVGYGATSKSTTVLNYCGIGGEHIEFICDTTPAKQGKFTPGSHIPVLPPDRFHRKYPDYAVLFAWNHRAEIFEKEQEFVAGGGKWIVFVPEVAVV